MGRNYKKFEVYKLAHKFVLRIYHLTRTFPNFEKGNLISQMNRAVVSICCNIAEGSTKPTPKEFLYFLGIAYGSAKELEVLLNIAKDVDYINEQHYEELSEESDELNSKLYIFMRHVEKETKHKFYQSFEINQLKK